MHLIIRYHRPLGAHDAETLSPDIEWLPTWRVDGPDESPGLNRGTSVVLAEETRLPIVAAGSLLETRDIYLDLRNPAAGPFRSLEGQTAGDGNAYVAKGDLPLDFWDQLVRLCSRAGALVFDAARTGASFDVVLVLEPVSRASESELIVGS